MVDDERVTLILHSVSLAHLRQAGAMQDSSNDECDERVMGAIVQTACSTVKPPFAISGVQDNQPRTCPQCYPPAALRAAMWAGSVAGG